MRSARMESLSHPAEINQEPEATGATSDHPESVEEPFAGDDSDPEQREEEEEVFVNRPRTLSEQPAQQTPDMGMRQDEDDSRPRRSSLETASKVQLQRAVQLKESGNDMFYESQYFDALELYKKAGKLFMRALKAAPYLKETTNLQELLNECCINSALSYLHLKQYEPAVKMINSLIKIDETQQRNPKALYLRGQAYFGKHQLVLALADIQQAEAIRPNDPNIQKLAKKLRDTIRTNKIITPALSQTTSASSRGSGVSELSKALLDASGPQTKLDSQQNRNYSIHSMGVVRMWQMCVVIFKHKLLKRPANLLGLVLLIVALFSAGRKLWRVRSKAWKLLRSLLGK